MYNNHYYNPFISKPISMQQASSNIFQENHIVFNDFLQSFSPVEQSKKSLFVREFNEHTEQNTTASVLNSWEFYMSELEYE